MKKTRKGKKPTLKEKPKQKLKKTAKRPKKLWGLEVRTFNKAAQQYMDQDYVGKLNDEEKQWLSTFNNEFYGNTLNKDWRKNLHYKGNKKAIYDQTNARNRDMYNNLYKYNEGDIRENHSLELLINSKIDQSHTNPIDAYNETIDLRKTITEFMENARKSGMAEDEVLTLTKKIFDLE